MILLKSSFNPKPMDGSCDFSCHLNNNHKKFSHDYNE